MKITKCLLIFLLVVCVAMAAVACNPTEPENPEDPTGPSTPADPSDPSDPADPSDPSDPVTPVKHTVTWQNGSSFTFTTETGEALPATQEVDNGSSLKFKVAVNDNTMGVTKVVAGDDTLTADANGVYTVVVNDDITVSALVQKLSIVSIEVTTAPTRKEYFAGDTLDKTGMVVTATYNNGVTGAITDYEVRYAYGTALSTGDTAVTIAVGSLTCELTGLTVRDHVPFTNVAVSLTAVEGKPVLTVTGTLGDATMATLEIKGCGKHNATLNGKDFTIAIDLATVIAGAKGGDWLDLKLFHSAEHYIDLTDSQATDMSATVVYEGRKYFFASYESALKIVWEDAEPFKALGTTLEVVGGVPTLKVTGTLGTAPNAKLDIKGCGQYEATYSGEGNKDFTISVNLATALASSEAGDWLDLKLYYGESYTDLYKEQATNYDASFISAGRRYFFASWGISEDAPQALKIVWEAVPDYTAEAGVEIVGDKAVITVTGVGDAALAGTDSGIKAWYDADIAFTGSVDATGAFVYTYELDENAKAATMWLHKYENGSKKGDLKGTVAAGKESVTIGRRVITVVSDNGQLKVVVAEVPSYTAEVGLAVVGDQVVLTVTGQINEDADQRRVHAWCGNGIDFVETSKDAEGVYVYTYTFDSLATGDTMYLHMMLGNQEKNLAGTIKEGAGSVTHGGKTYTIARDGASGEITVKIANA